jgi:hypothetical protein
VNKTGSFLLKATCQIKTTIRLLDRKEGKLKHELSPLIFQMYVLDKCMLVSERASGSKSERVSLRVFI